MLTHRKYLNEKELKHLKEVLKNTKDDKFTLFIYFALCTGARLNEIQRLEKTDITGDIVVLKSSKGSNIRELPIPKWLAEGIKNLPGHTPFKMSRDTVTRYWHFYRPSPTKSFHCLRHTFAIQLYKKSKDIRLVKYALGHKSIKNTMVYQDYVYQVKEIRGFLL
jgi:integrase/recombinase XerC